MQVACWAAHVCVQAQPHQPSVLGTMLWSTAARSHLRFCKHLCLACGVCHQSFQMPYIQNPKSGANGVCGDTCQANLSCARATAKSNAAITDIKCTACMRCPHTIPGRNTVISCPTAEQFAIYDILLGMVVQQHKLGAFGLDINCQYSGHIRKLHPSIAKQVHHRVAALKGWPRASLPVGVQRSLRRCWPWPLHCRTERAAVGEFKNLVFVTACAAFGMFVVCRCMCRCVCPCPYALNSC